MPIAARVEGLLAGDDPVDAARSMARTTAGFAEVLATEPPDVLVVLGDRFEVHAAAVAAVPFALPIGHIAGGDVTEGAIDDALRHSLTKLSHLHFVATDGAGARVARMGEEAWRIAVVGALGLDALRAVPDLGDDELRARVGPVVDGPFVLVTQHPETLDLSGTGEHADAVFAAIRASGLPAVVTAPNADPGREVIVARARRVLEQEPGWAWVEAAGVAVYKALMRRASAMVGNSSSGLVEAAAVGLPVVDVGTRQQGRERPANVLHADADADAIGAALRRALDPAFRAACDGVENPYGDGGAAGRIAERLATVPLGPELVRKRFADEGTA